MQPMAKAKTQDLKRYAGEAAALLKALANEQRLSILCSLLDGPLSVGQLNEKVELSQSALSQHLAVLREGGLVETEKEAQTVYYSLAAGPAQKVLSTLKDIYCPR
jgi:ArsR family transcriptional regulator, virulence genes transcriptional regulator